MNHMMFECQSLLFSFDQFLEIFDDFYLLKNPINVTKMQVLKLLMEILAQ